MAQTAAQPDLVELGPRTPSPVRRLNVLLALGTAAVACLLYVAALFTEVLPPRGLAVAFFAAAPLFAAVALWILVLRNRLDSEPTIGWVCTGLGVGILAMVLQLVSFPAVSPGGGLLGTGDQGSAALYLLFHLSLGAGAAAGALRVPPRWRWVALAAGVLLALLLALDVVPLPMLLRPDGSFTGLLKVIEYVLAGVLAGCAVLWLRMAGPVPPALQGWIGVALSLAVYDVVLNALGGARYAPVWWASLSLRVATYAVLAAGSAWTVVAQLRDLERYSDAELARREGQLRRSLGHTRQLLSCTGALSRAVTAEEVATVLCVQATAATGLPHAAVLVGAAGSPLQMLGSVGYDEAMSSLTGQIGWDAPLPGERVALTGVPVFLGSRPEVEAEFPELPRMIAQDVCAVAALAIRVRGEPIGTLMVWSTSGHGWSSAQRELLAGIAAQGGEALARAEAYEAQANAARTLQESLLPSTLPARGDLVLASRYVAGERGLRVGGDWYDCVEVGDHLVALVVGDVMGKGLRAAALMGQMRTTLRSLTAIDPSPAVVLQALDHATLDLALDEIATVAYVLLDLSTGVARYARAGHLPPLLVTPDGVTSPLYGGGSPPLGAPAEARGEDAVQVPVGSLFVLYTDGVVETRESALDDLPAFTSRVGELAGRYGRVPDEVATGLLDSKTSRDDDVSLLLAQYTGTALEEPLVLPRALATPLRPESV